MMVIIGALITYRIPHQLLHPIKRTKYYLLAVEMKKYYRCEGGGEILTLGTANKTHTRYDARVNDDDGKSVRNYTYQLNTAERMVMH